MNKQILLTAAAVSAFATVASAQMMWGGAPVPERDSGWSVSAGAILNLEGSVDELSRGYYTASGQDEKQALAEGRALSVGGRVQFMNFEGDITSDATNEADILSRRERFDKSVEFEVLIAMLTVGFNF